LWFDPRERHAYVKVRHATWRSYELGIYGGRVLATIVCLFLLVKTLDLTSEREPWQRLLAFVVVLGLLVPPVAIVIRSSTQRFLARRIFPTTTTFWFTPKAIGFRSKLYVNPVAVRRHWNNTPVSCEFGIVQDQLAAERQAAIQNRKPEDSRHFGNAQILRLVISTNSNQTLSKDGQVPASRSVWITEVDAGLAECLSMVCAAAMNLTLHRPTEVFNSRPGNGRDIDRL
jgi:fumarate reductase subunit C